MYITFPLLMSNFSVVCNDIHGFIFHNFLNHAYNSKYNYTFCTLFFLPVR